MALPKSQTPILTPFTTPPPAGPLTTTLPTQIATRGQKEVADEYLTQRSVIEAQGAKTILAERMHAMVTRYTAEVGVHTIEQIEYVQAQSSSPTVQAFCDRLKNTYAYQAAEMAFTGGALMNDEVARRLHPESKERRRGWFE